MMAILNEAFNVIPPDELQPQEPMLRQLSRAAAQEFQLLASLALVCSSNLAVPFSEEIFASDASNEKGGICEALVSEELSKVLWRSADRRRDPLPLLSRSQIILSQYEQMYEELPADKVQAEGPQFVGDACGENLGEEGAPFEVPCERPIGMRFDFIEICGGAAGVTKELVKEGVSCGPVLDLSVSKQFDISEHRVIQWVVFMLEEDRLETFLVSPPCTSFSPAAHPCVRSYKEPRGFDQQNWKVRIGNLLAFAALTFLFVAYRMQKSGLGETPRRSKMRWLEEWKRLIALGAEEVFLASCMYGSVHQKEFCFLGVNMHVKLLHRRCSRDHQHIRIQGKYTKMSAIYCEGLCGALAVFFRDHILAKRRAGERFAVRSQGLEDVLTNDCCLSLQWKTIAAWRWSSRSHINVLEVAACIKLLRDLVRKGGDLRQTIFLDSHVALSVFVRGRSSAKSLQHQLRKFAVLCIAGGLYPAFRFAPTRMNPADAPTRDREVPSPESFTVLANCSAESQHVAARCKGLRRWAANWARLVLLLHTSLLPFLACHDLRKHPICPILQREWTLDFDSTLGYPGEGPLFRLFVSLSAVWGFLGLVVAVGPSHGDEQRKHQRSGIVLEEGRRVTETTANVRGLLFQNFLGWLSDQGVDFDDLVMSSPPDVDRINKVLVQYGKWLFSEGKPYYHLSETINLVTSKRPVIRRSLQQAWDLCFMWGSHEPVEHHVAMPYQILIALISAAWWWGWHREAAVFALSWGALLRIGEVYEAKRSDLILPEDVDNTNDFALLRIREPKTRFRAARHQAGRLEHVDLLEVVKIGFQRLRPEEKLWPFSGATLRSRLHKLLHQLGLPTELQNKPKPLSLASFRPGGATHMISVCDNAETVRRRGRWASFKVMEIYLQEVSSSTYLNLISNESKLNVLNGLKVFPSLLQKILVFYKCRIPATTWYFLLRADVCDDFNVQGGKVGDVKTNQNPAANHTYNSRLRG